MEEKVEEKPKRRRHDTDSDSDEEEKDKQKPAEVNVHTQEMASGLQSLEDIRKANEAKQKVSMVSEAEAFDNAKGQKAVYRDKDGRIISETEKAESMMSKKDKLKLMNQQRLNMWSRGVVQIQERRDRNQPKDTKEDDGDKQVDEELKERQRFGDPIKEIRKYQKGNATDKDKTVLWSRKIFPP